MRENTTALVTVWGLLCGIEQREGLGSKRCGIFESFIFQFIDYVFSFPAIHIPMPDFTHTYAFMHRQKMVTMGLFLKVQMAKFTLPCMQPKPMQIRLILLCSEPGYTRSIFE